MPTHDESALAAKPTLDGARLRQLRRERGISARKLAEQADLCVRQIWRMEAGHRPNVRAVTVVRIALALGTSWVAQLQVRVDETDYTQQETTNSSTERMWVSTNGVRHSRTSRKQRPRGIWRANRLPSRFSRRSGPLRHYLHRPASHASRLASREQSATSTRPNVTPMQPITRPGSCPVQSFLPPAFANDPAPPDDPC